MISKFIKNLYKSLASRKLVQTEKAIKNTEEKRRLNIELYTQSINNVRYIDASINTMSASLNNIKSQDAGETKRRKTFIRDKIGWYSKKLEEEKAMIIHFSSIKKMT